MSRTAVARCSRHETIDRQQLRRALATAWSEETSLDPTNWSSRNTAWGQCAITALIVQDYFGGELKRGQLPDTSHYWNRLPNGEDLDFTVVQFDRPPVFSDISFRTREALLANETTRARYNKLSQAVRTLLSL